jgi:hypothetical protein
MSTLYPHFFSFYPFSSLAVLRLETRHRLNRPLRSTMYTDNEAKIAEVNTTTCSQQLK